MYKLVISDDEGKTTVVPLVRDEITIGRKEGNTIRLTERNVSRKHARLARADGGFVIHDLDSYNGIRINGERIDGKRRLNAGDDVLIGDYTIALQSEEGTGRKKPDAAAGPPARLVMLTPPAPGAEFAIPEGAVRIGRAEDLDIWVNHRSISREHAEIRREGDDVRVTDLDSANGVRLNAEEIQDAALSPGDELELGQVRFRFVGEGERYSFEADRTVQMDAVILPDEEPRRNPFLLFAAIVAVAALIGAVIAVSVGDDEPPQPIVNPLVPVDDPPEDPNHAVNSANEIAAALLAETEACVAALRDQNYTLATAAADRALAIDASSISAQDCRARAATRVSAQEQFEEGIAHLRADRIDDAWMAFDSLPSQSPFRDRPEVGEARTRFVESYLASAEGIGTDDPEEARRLLHQVFAVGDTEEDAATIRAARILERSLDRNGRTRPHSPMNMQPRGMRNDMVAMVPVVTNMVPMVPMQPATMTAAPTFLEIMRECNRRNRCVAQRLEQGPRNAITLPQLIATYRELGNDGRARQLMREYIRRFPSGRNHAEYQRILNAN